MIPHKLQLKNFLSYGSTLQTIDFSQYHLICLSGRNGHGKSALLDAITWAIWGQARKVSGSVKPDEGLLRLGQTQMMVVLDFELNGTMYRVKREYFKTYGKPVTSLEFGILDEQTNNIIPLTDKTIRMTQAKIEQTLRLDYQSFSNSAFLRQGQANEFSKKSSKDRKQVLATILGLDQYEQLKKRALEKTKEALTKKNALLMIQDKQKQDLDQESLLKKELNEIKTKLSHFALQEKQNLKEKKSIEKRQQQFLQEQKELEILEFKHHTLEKQIEKKHEEIRHQFQTWRTIHKKQLCIQNPSILQSKKEQLQKKLEAIQKKLQRSLELKEQLLQAKELLHTIITTEKEKHQKSLARKKIVLEKNILKKEHAVTAQEKYTKELTHLTREKTTFEKELKELKLIEKEFNQKGKAFTKQETLFEKRKTAYQHFISLGNGLSQKLQQLAQKNTLVHDEQNPSCPLCEQNLSASRRKFLTARFDAQHRLYTHQFQRMTKVIKSLKSTLLAQHETIKANKEQLNQYQVRLGQTPTISSNYTKISEHINHLEKQINKNEKLISELHKTIEADKGELLKQEAQAKSKEAQSAEYKTAKRQLESIEKDIKSLKYNQKEHKDIQHEYNDIERYLKEYQEIQKEIDKQSERKNAIHQLCNQVREYKKQLIGLEKNIKPFINLPKQKKEIDDQTQALNTKLETLRKEHTQTIEHKGKLEAQINKINQIHKEHKEQQKQINQLDETILDYHVIASATGKDGIQALLIEHAIPEIEQEANILLAKLTNNQAQISIESLRDLKKGGTKETLDIKISDPAGIRPYELFSGGEAFRIDFALRIAISKLLARRAGTALQTLIIDEGFGSQDEQGLQHIMDAIHKIQDDFSKIIIVSHLDALKEQFPVHFLVEKNATGSHVHVIEHG